MAGFGIELAELLVESYRKRPIVTLIGVTLFLSLFGILMVVFTNEADKAEEQRRRENLTYNQQIDALNQVEGSLKNLTQFVELQKQKLRESEDVINDLKKEEEKLRPVVETDRKTIEALFELQSQKYREDIWKERGIGFVLGIIASLIASFLYTLVLRNDSYCRNGHDSCTLPACPGKHSPSA